MCDHVRWRRDSVFLRDPRCRRASRIARHVRIQGKLLDAQHGDAATRLPRLGDRRAVEALGARRSTRRTRPGFVAARGRHTPGYPADPRGSRDPRTMTLEPDPQWSRISRIPPEGGGRRDRRHRLPRGARALGLPDACVEEELRRAELILHAGPDLKFGRVPGRAARSARRSAPCTATPTSRRCASCSRPRPRSTSAEARICDHPRPGPPGGSARSVSPPGSRISRQSSTASRICRTSSGEAASRYPSDPARPRNGGAGRSARCSGSRSTGPSYDPEPSSPALGS